MPDDTTMGPALEADTAFFKGHGLGNDYLVFEAREGGDGKGDDGTRKGRGVRGLGRGGDPTAENAGWTVGPEAVRLLCHRHRGVGGDGVVFRVGHGEAGGAGGGHRLRMFNPDGGEFERSGNGLRVFAGYLAARDEAPAGPFRVSTGGEEVSMEVAGRSVEGECDVSVGMGRAGVGLEAVGAEPRVLEGAGSSEVVLLGPDGEELDVQPVSVGNPHCVVFGRGVGEGDARRVGPHLERHPAFRHGTNVQLVEVADAEGGAGDGEAAARVRLTIWERGVGPTSASGTSACAAAVACVERGRVPPGEVAVEMAGGTLWVRVGRDREVTLRGPVREVHWGTLTEGFRRALDGAPSAAAPGG